VGLITAAGNITGGNIRSLGIISTTGTVINSDIDTSGNIDADGYISAVGNVTGGNLITAGLVTVTGNITAGNITSAGQTITTGNITGGNIVTGGVVSAIGNADSGNVNTTRVSASGNVVSGNVQTAGSVLSSGTAGVGYTTGAGGTVTQLTSKSTGVTLNAISGEITTSNANLVGDTSVTFTLTNSAIAATDVMILNHVSGGTIGKYTFNASCAAGSASITIHNVNSGGGSAEAAALVLRFAVIKAAVA
jgi:hypothetical protein